MWTAPEVASPAHFADAPRSVPTWGHRTERTVDGM
jgi:hypothetical protein